MSQLELEYHDLLSLFEFLVPWLGLSRVLGLRIVALRIRVWLFFADRVSGGFWYCRVRIRGVFWLIQKSWVFKLLIRVVTYHSQIL